MFTQVTYNIRENEHQELFYLNINPLQPVHIHIPSPLGRLPYYIYVRVPRDVVESLGNVGMRLDVGGLREDHVSVAPGEGVTGEAIVPAKQMGYTWRCLGVAKVSRGDGTLVFENWPESLTHADLLLCTWPRFIASGQADDWIAAQADPCWAPSGVPLGGIGGGRVDICRDGRFRNFSMNNNQDAPLEDPDGLPGAYLAVACEGVVKDLASRTIFGDHTPCETLEFIPRFPQAQLRVPRLLPGLEVAVTLSGTLCPQDLRRSSIPGVLIRWQVRNTSQAKRTVQCRLGWPNLLGTGGGIARAETHIGYGDGYYHHWDNPTDRDEVVCEKETFAAVRFTGNPPESLKSSDGEHWLGVARTDGVTATATCGRWQGEIVAELVVPAGGTAIATMALVTAMPHWIDAQGTDRGHLWQVYFPGGEAMLTALLAEADEILTEAGALAKLIDESTLPSWLKQRLSNCNYPLVTNSVLYRDGRFSINEGPTEMAGCYGTIDQRLAAHPATQLLFPQLNATELSLFAAIQGEIGGIQHDLGGGHLERKPGEVSWPDLTCSFVIQTARHAWSTGDEQFAAAMWPRARRALYRHAAWATEGQGVAQVGRGLGTSYDSYHYIGTTAYMATLWLAALAVGEKWAQKMGDADVLAEIPAWRTAAIQRLNADLWNGLYYIAYGDTTGVRRETCHAGQLAGQVFTRLLTGMDVLEEERLQACADALLNMNGNVRFAIPPDEVSPDGSSAADFGWLPYVEGFMLSALATLGDTRMWPVWERMVAAMEWDNKYPCDTRLMYRPLTGEQSWGAYYMTAPASWLVYDAWLDFFYEPGTGLLRLRGLAPGRFPVIHPLFWGMAEVSNDGQVKLTVRRMCTEKTCTVTTLELPLAEEIVQIRGQLVHPEGQTERHKRYRLPQPVTLKPGAFVIWRAL